jgi:hypothetical protein
MGTSYRCCTYIFVCVFVKSLLTNCSVLVSNARDTDLGKVVISAIYNGPTNALVCNKTLIQMSHTKTFKITPTCFDHQMIIIRELFDPG